MFQKIQLINSLKANNDAVNTFVTTPSNKIISISSDGSITIFDKFFHIKQKIKKAHNGTIFDISLKDGNNFATCSEDKSIKTWMISPNNNYILNKSINNIHDNDIHKIEYLEDFSIISGSKDEKIKILKLVNNEYICNIIIDNHSPVYSLLYLKEDNLLISAGLTFSCFWDLTNILSTLIVKISAYCHGENALQKIDNERVVVGGVAKIQIISIKEKKIIKEIETDFLVWAICVIKKRKIFICGGVSNDIAIFNSDTYDKITTIQNSHNGNIRGISLLNNGNIISGSEDTKTKIWEFIYQKK